MLKNVHNALKMTGITWLKVGFPTRVQCLRFSANTTLLLTIRSNGIRAFANLQVLFKELNSFIVFKGVGTFSDPAIAFGQCNNFFRAQLTIQMRPFFRLPRTLSSGLDVRPRRRRKCKWASIRRVTSDAPFSPLSFPTTHLIYNPGYAYPIRYVCTVVNY